MRSEAAILLLAVLPGCSSVSRISGSANAIRSEASVLRTHGEATNDKVVVDGAQRIYDLAADIHATLPGVEDKVPAWMELALWAAVAVVAVAACVILWQTGIGTAIRVAIGWIPRKTQRDAELAVAMMDPEKSEDVREYISARRASSPLFDAAFSKTRAEKEKHNAG